MSTKKIERILIPTDYSINAKRAMQMGVSLAKEIGAEVFLFHSYNIAAVNVAENVIIMEDLTQLEEARINDALSEMKMEYGDVTIHALLEFGPLADWINKIVDDNKIDLIVMGTKGETDALNKVFGSVATHVINNVKCPVLIIPNGHRSYNISEVVFATDFHFTNDVANYLAPFLQFAEEFDPFIHVVQFKSLIGPGTHIKNIEELKLTGLLKETKHSYHYIESENTEQALFEFAEKSHCDLIVMVTRHYTLWERIFHHSLTKKIALHSEIPVLILHEK